MENFRLLIVFSVIFALTKGQSLSCDYWGTEDSYTCDLTIDNSGGLDNFASISGDHESGFDDNDVIEVKFIAGETPIVPVIICSVFPNLMRIYLDRFDVKLQTITDTSFSGCLKLTEILIEGLGGEIQANSLINNVDLVKFRVSKSDITSVPESLFNNCHKLNHVSIRENYYLNNLPPLIFANNLELKWAFLNNNGFTTWHQEWFQSNTKLEFLEIANNSLTSIPSQALNSKILTRLDISEQLFTSLDSASFGDLSGLREFEIQDNNIDKIDVRIINRAKNLQTLKTSGNTCTQNNYYNFNTNLEENIQEMNDCFVNYGIVNYAYNTTNTFPIVNQIQNSTTIEIGILVSQDAIVILASENTARQNPYLKLTLGSSGNSKTTIMKNGKHLEALITPSILSAVEMRFFTISWSEDGEFLKVSKGVGSQLEEILSYNKTTFDSSSIKFIGTTTRNLRASWIIREI